jgi:hypothetical protein
MENVNHSSLELTRTPPGVCSMLRYSVRSITRPGIDRTLLSLQTEEFPVGKF